MCSWAWGSAPKLRLLRWRYEDRGDWRLMMERIFAPASGEYASDVTDEELAWP